MTRRRTAWRAFLTGTAAMLFTAPAVAPAAAHGAPVGPVSRAVACSSLGGAAARTAACRAATALHAGQPFDDWDNLRVAGVAGRDRQVIPDGELCSAGLQEYRGLDLPRADWPATGLTAGGRFTLAYRTTIPHEGTFQLYLTQDGYDPAQPLTWSEISSEPFLTVTDPPVTGGAYRLTGRLPSDRTGRHILYTVWRNTSTADTYYSCSDLVLSRTAEQSTPPTGPPTAQATPTRTATTPPSTPTSTPAPAASSESRFAPTSAPGAVTEPPAQPLSATGTAGHAGLLAAGGAAAALCGALAMALALRHRRHARHRRRR